MDILSLANLIDEFIVAEVEILNSQNIKHPTTIGSMYEGLTHDILHKTMFSGLNLKIVKNSFIVGCDKEFDVMLVEGEGEIIPYTDRYKYKPESIIAIIQVKKNLYTNDLEEGYNNLQFLIDQYVDKDPDEYMFRLFRDAFRAICRKDITAFRADELSENEKLIYNTLKIEACLPVRIVWGYNGFKDEFNFRESFYTYLSNNLSTANNMKVGFGPHNFPNLIICGSLSMMKQNGNPFGSPILEDKWWPFYTSSSYNPTYYLLEAIWTRLSYRYETLPNEIFGEDLSVEPINRYLDGKIHPGTLEGWDYNYFVIKRRDLKKNIAVVNWQPVLIDEKQYVIIQELGANSIIDLDQDKGLEKFVVEGGKYQSLDDFLNNLINTGLVYIEKRKLKLLTDECACVSINGEWYAAENKSGRLMNWAYKEIEKQKRN